MTRLFSRIVITGLGLLGSSVGLAAKRERIAAEIVGLDRSASHASEALRLGVVDRVATDYRKALAGLSVDGEPVLIVAAVPVGSVVRQMKDAADAIRAENNAVGKTNRLFLLTETASVQSEIMKDLPCDLPENAVFIGSHPIAGSEKSGPAAGRADLFTQRRIVLTPPDPSANRQAEAMSILESFWRRLGGNVSCLSAEDHDRILARTSHLPHLMSVMLSEIPSDADRAFCGTGWSGMTRLSASDPEVWADIFEANRLAVLDALREMKILWSKWEAVLENGDRDRIFTLLQEVKKRRDALGS